MGLMDWSPRHGFIITDSGLLLLPTGRMDGLIPELSGQTNIAAMRSIL